jgi:hypothetical protein
MNDQSGFALLGLARDVVRDVLRAGDDRGVAVFAVLARFSAEERTDAVRLTDSGPVFPVELGASSPTGQLRRIVPPARFQLPPEYLRLDQAIDLLPLVENRLLQSTDSVGQVFGFILRFPVDRADDVPDHGPQNEVSGHRHDWHAKDEEDRENRNQQSEIKHGTSVRLTVGSYSASGAASASFGIQPMRPKPAM